MEWRAKLEGLDEVFAKEEQEIVDNEKEKQVIEGEVSQAQECLKTTEKYLKLLQIENAKCNYILGTTKDKLQHSMSLQLVQEAQDHKKEIIEQERETINIMERSIKAKLELQRIRENMKVLTGNFSELSARQNSLREKKCELLATLRQHEEALNRALQEEFPIPHPSPEKDKVKTH